MTKPGLLVLGSTFPAKPNDGVPAFVQDLALQEAKRFSVTVLTPMVRGAMRRETLTVGNQSIEVVRYRYFFKRFEDLADGAILDNLKAKRSRLLQVLPLMVALWFSVRKLTREIKPAAIHAHWVIPQGLIAAFAAPKVPLLITTHGGDIYALNMGPVLALKKMVFKRAAQITTVNSEMKKRLVEFGNAPEKVHVLPMGVDTALAAAAGKNAKKKPGQLLVVGRLVEKKGIEYLLEAIKQPNLKNRVQLKVIGDGPLRQQLESLAVGLPVEFLGQLGRDEVFKAIAESEVMLLPSVTAKSGDQEGLPVTLLEGGAGNVCVIATDLPGINEVIVDGESGLLIEQRSSKAIAEALEKVLASKALRENYANGLIESVKRFDINNVGAGYCETIELCIGEKQKS